MKESRGKFNISDGELQSLLKYVSFINSAARRYGLPNSILAAIGSRESRWGLALNPGGPAGTGDFAPRNYPSRYRAGPLPPDGGGFGRGLMQIDYDYHEFARTGRWSDPQANIEYGAEILGKFLVYLNRKTSLRDQYLLRAAIASYNAGPRKIVKAIKRGLDIDFYTSDRNYSRDVLRKAEYFRARI